MTDSVAAPAEPANPLSHTREQLYANQAYRDVQAFSTQHEQKERDSYTSTVQSLPVLVRTAGLAQALAFVASRKETGQQAILGHLDTLLRGDLGGESLLDRSRKAELSEYMYLTRQVMSALLWYKRYAEWLLDEKRLNVGSGAPPAEPAMPEEHAT